MHYHHFKAAEFLVNMLENRFSFLGFKFGLDPVLGLIPGIGDMATFLLGGYIVWIAQQMNVPEDKLKEMYRNIVLDFFIGIIPIVGDLSDFVYKANSRNLEILRRHIPAEVVEGRII